MSIGERVAGDKDELGATSRVPPIAVQLLWHTVFVERIPNGVEPDRRRARAFRRVHQPCLLILHPLLVFDGSKFVGYSVPAASEVDHTFDNRWSLTG